MKYALNTKKGTTIQHPDVTLPGCIAVPVQDNIANQLKHIINVVIFDDVIGIDKEKRAQQLYGLKPNLEVK